MPRKGGKCSKCKSTVGFTEIGRTNDTVKVRCDKCGHEYMSTSRYLRRSLDYLAGKARAAASREQEARKGRVS